MKMDILSVLEHKFPSFSKGQRTIAQFILKNYDKAAFMTAARLGEVTGVSESTVVRFAADLGYRGYPGMKKSAAGDRAQPSDLGRAHRGG